jgi:TonB family protein
MVIRSGVPRNNNQPEVAAPTLQLATGAAPIAFSSKAYVPSAPTTNLVPATLLRKVAPTYPGGVSSPGSVTVSATIQKDGRLGNIKAISGHPLLRSAAVDALRQWQYKPASSGGRPVESTVEIKINFERRH